MSLISSLARIICFVGLVGMLGCASSSTVATVEEMQALTGTWQYETAGLDVLDLRTGTLQFAMEGETLTGAFDAPHLALVPMRNIRYLSDGTLNFQLRINPARTGGIAFSMMVNGDSMEGIAYPSEGGIGQEAMANPGAGANSNEIRARRIR